MESDSTSFRSYFEYYSSEFNIPSSALDFSVLKLDTSRAGLFKEAVDANVVNNCIGCFKCYSKLHYALMSKFVYVNRQPVKDFVSSSEKLYRDLQNVFETCLENHNQNEACLACQGRYMRKICEHIQRYGGSDWRPPIRFASSFGYFINELVILWQNCYVGCIPAVARSRARG